MRGVFKGFRRFAVLLTLVTVLVAPAALADGGESDDSLFDEFGQYVMVLMSRIGWPPG